MDAWIKTDTRIQFDTRYCFDTVCGPEWFELVAVSEHYGGIASGHYTALCNVDGEWVGFDDEDSFKAEFDGGAGYVLFWEKCNANK